MPTRYSHHLEVALATGPYRGHSDLVGGVFQSFTDEANYTPTKLKIY